MSKADCGWLEAIEPLQEATRLDRRSAELATVEEVMLWKRFVLLKELLVGAVGCHLF
jgi:hypothetical protein